MLVFRIVNSEMREGSTHTGGYIVELDGQDAETVQTYAEMYSCQISEVVNPAFPNEYKLVTLFSAARYTSRARSAVMSALPDDPLPSDEMRRTFDLEEREIWPVTALVRYALGRTIGNLGDEIAYVLFEAGVPDDKVMGQTRPEQAQFEEDMRMLHQQGEAALVRDVQAGHADVAFGPDGTAHVIATDRIRMDDQPVDVDLTAQDRDEVSSFEGPDEGVVSSHRSGRLGPSAPYDQEVDTQS